MKKLRSTRIAATLLVACVSLATAQAAHAQAPSAADHAKKAQTAYDLQNWKSAISEYQAAYQAEPKPEYLWGLAQAQRLSGDCASAIKTFKAFKRHDTVTANQGTAAELQIAKCEAEIEKQEAEAARQASAPAPAPAPTTPATTPPAAAPAPAPAPAKPSGPKRFYEDVLGDVLFVGGVAAGGVGAYFLFSGNSDMSATASAPTYRAYDTGADDAAKKQTIGGLVLAGGGVLVGLAIVRYLTMDTGVKSDQPQTGLVVGPGSMGYVGRF